MGDKYGVDVGRPDARRSQRAGQQPSVGNPLWRMRQLGRGSNVVGERDLGRPDTRIHEDRETLPLNQEAPDRDVVGRVVLQQLRVGAEVQTRVEHGWQMNRTVIECGDLDAAHADDRGHGLPS
jgi:hypothetical protein